MLNEDGYDWFDLTPGKLELFAVHQLQKQLLELRSSGLGDEWSWSKISKYIHSCSKLDEDKRRGTKDLSRSLQAATNNLESVTGRMEAHSGEKLEENRQRRKAVRKHTVEKNQINVTSVTLHLLRQAT